MKLIEEMSEAGQDENGRYVFDEPPPEPEEEEEEEGDDQKEGLISKADDMLESSGIQVLKVGSRGLAQDPSHIVYRVKWPDGAVWKYEVPAPRVRLLKGLKGGQLANRVKALSTIASISGGGS